MCLCTGLFLLVLGNSAFSQHTFSIVAVDSATGEIGSAGATCLNNSSCGGCGGAIIISGLVPGRGACNAQATVCIPNTNLNSVITNLTNGMSAQQSLDNVLTFDGCVFGDTSDRQYGVVDLDSNGSPRVASFTGSGTMSYANHITGPNYSIQGNILLGQEILDSMQAGFVNTNGPLCDKLMAALQGANVKGADTRCLDDSTSSLSAFIRVTKPGDSAGNFWMDLNVPEVPALVEPIDSLQSMFDAWKLAAGIATEEEWLPKVYPNPATDHVVVERKRANGAMEIRFVDITGRVLQRVDSKLKSVEVETSDFSRGVYFITVEQARRRSSHRLIIR